jgi:hypothetical protein
MRIRSYLSLDVLNEVLNILRRQHNEEAVRPPGSDRPIVYGMIRIDTFMLLGLLVLFALCPTTTADPSHPPKVTSFCYNGTDLGEPRWTGLTGGIQEDRLICRSWLIPNEHLEYEKISLSLENLMCLYSSGEGDFCRLMVDSGRPRLDMAGFLESSVSLDTVTSEEGMSECQVEHMAKHARHVSDCPEHPFGNGTIFDTVCSLVHYPYESIFRVSCYPWIQWLGPDAVSMPGSGVPLTSSSASLCSLYQEVNGTWDEIQPILAAVPDFRYPHFSPYALHNSAAVGWVSVLPDTDVDHPHRTIVAANSKVELGKSLMVNLHANDTVFSDSALPECLPFFAQNAPSNLLLLPARSRRFANNGSSAPSRLLYSFNYDFTEIGFSFSDPACVSGSTITYRVVLTSVNPVLILDSHTSVSLDMNQQFTTVLPYLKGDYTIQLDWQCGTYLTSVPFDVKPHSYCSQPAECYLCYSYPLRSGFCYEPLRVTVIILLVLIGLMLIWRLYVNFLVAREVIGFFFYFLATVTMVRFIYKWIKTSFHKYREKKELKKKKEDIDRLPEVPTALAIIAFALQLLAFPVALGDKCQVFPTSQSFPIAQSTITECDSGVCHVVFSTSENVAAATGTAISFQLGSAAGNSSGLNVQFKIEYLVLSFPLVFRYMSPADSTLVEVFALNRYCRNAQDHTACKPEVVQVPYQHPPLPPGQNSSTTTYASWYEAGSTTHCVNYDQCNLLTLGFSGTVPNGTDNMQFVYDITPPSPVISVTIYADTKSNSTQMLFDCYQDTQNATMGSVTEFTFNTPSGSITLDLGAPDFGSITYPKTIVAATPDSIPVSRLKQNSGFQLTDEQYAIYVTPTADTGAPDVSKVGCYQLSGGSFTGTRVNPTFSSFPSTDMRHNSMNNVYSGCGLAGLRDPKVTSSLDAASFGHLAWVTQLRSWDPKLIYPVFDASATLTSSMGFQATVSSKDYELWATNSLACPVVGTPAAVANITIAQNFASWVSINVHSSCRGTSLGISWTSKDTSQGSTFCSVGSTASSTCVVYVIAESKEGTISFTLKGDKTVNFDIKYNASENGFKPCDQGCIPHGQTGCTMPDGSPCTNSGPSGSGAFNNFLKDLLGAMWDLFSVFGDIGQVIVSILWILLWAVVIVMFLRYLYRLYCRKRDTLSEYQKSLRDVPYHRRPLVASLDAYKAGYEYISPLFTRPKEKAEDPDNESVDGESDSEDDDPAPPPAAASVSLSGFRRRPFNR